MKDPNASFITLPDHSLANFTRGLLQTKNWMDAHATDEAAQVLTLYAWNEWHEGGRIEPNARDGAQSLNAVSEVFQLPIGNDPCRTTGLCAGPP
jgi:hypothetical protein